MASAGNGSVSHALGELFQMMADVTMTHMPYRGGAPAIADLLGGQAQVMFVVLPASIEHIKAGNLSPLTVTAATRLDALPDIPTLGEYLPGYEASGWQGIGAPKETPDTRAIQGGSAINHEDRGLHGRGAEPVQGLLAGLMQVS
jgi:tripartite-type tricarboxylate transporter receptor subunit TctC